MNKAIRATQQHFESSCNRTPEYLSWHRLFKREFTKFLTDKGAFCITIGKPNHFDMSGFFTLGNVIWYFSISDIRWSKEAMLLRTAQHYKDYTGGMNQYVSMMVDGNNFISQFNDIVNRNPKGELQPIHHSLFGNGG
jgi:hypothetical protein